MIQAKNAYICVKGNKMLSHLNFILPENSRTAIIGECGSGKTLLLMSLCGGISCAGRIEINGVRICRQNEEYVERHTAFAPFLGHKSEYTQKEEILNSLKILCTDSREIDNRMRWIEHIFGAFTDRPIWSDGERHRVSLAKALVKMPGVLLLDEPDALLSDKESVRLAGALRQLPGTQVFSTRNTEFIQKVCTHILFLENGTAQFGEIEEVLRSPKILKKCGLSVSKSPQFSSKWQKLF